MRKLIIIFILLSNVYAEDTFTLEEFKRIDWHVKSAVNKRFNPTKLKQIKQAAVEKYKLYKVGERFTATTGGKHYRGTIHRINRDTVQIGTHDFSKKDYPLHYFNKEFNLKARADYIHEHYIKAKRVYTKRAEDHYKQLTLKQRPQQKLEINAKDLQRLDSLPIRPLLNNVKNGTKKVDKPYELFEKMGKGTWIGNGNDGQVYFNKVKDEDKISAFYESYTNHDKATGYFVIKETVLLSNGGAIFKCFNHEKKTTCMIYILGKKLQWKTSAGTFSMSKKRTAADHFDELSKGILWILVLDGQIDRTFKISIDSKSIIGGLKTDITNIEYKKINSDTVSFNVTVLKFGRIKDNWIVTVDKKSKFMSINWLNNHGSISTYISNGFHSQ